MGFVSYAKFVSYMIADPNGDLLPGEFKSYSRAQSVVTFSNDEMWRPYNDRLTKIKPKGAYVLAFKYDDGYVGYDWAYTRNS